MENCIDKELPNARYERKFIAPACSVEEVIGLVRTHTAGFSELYPTRFVNNIYLDTESLGFYFVHVNGNARRHKVRIRWYGELCGKIDNPQLEIKFKQGLVGGKLTYPLPGFSLDENNPAHCIAAYPEALEPENKFKVYAECMKPTLINRYKRHYYQSWDGKFRLTLDSDLEFYDPNESCSPFYDRGSDWKHRVILELKYDMVHAEAAEAISNRFPFRMTRCSKYITGIELIQ